ncbi:MAG: hypothetical protein LZF62_260039 [Nitrospira sp.]|nr:MAG: hypothetical protein LZF62_260039 [Nitrospira sp.]
MPRSRKPRDHEKAAVQSLPWPCRAERSERERPVTWVSDYRNRYKSYLNRYDGTEACRVFPEVPLVFPISLHQLVGIGEEDGRAQERHVNENFPLDVFGILVAHVYEGLQKVNAGDANQ